MARIILSTGKLLNDRMLSIVQQMVDVRDELLRTKDIADEISLGGTVKSNLDAGTECEAGSGNGATFYDALVTMLAGVNSASVKAIVKQFDRG